MWIIPAAPILGVLIGLAAAKGDTRALRRTSIALWPVLAIAIVAGGAAAVFGSNGGATALVGISLLGTAVVAAGNLRNGGAGIVLTGVVLNLVPLALNAHIPVREAAIVNAGIATAEQLDSVQLGAGRAFADDQTQLEILGAVIPVRQVGEVFSFGDFIVIAGLFNYGFRLVKPDPRRHKTRLDQLRQRHPSQRDEEIIDLDALASIPPRHTPGLTPRPGTRTLEGSAAFGGPTHSPGGEP